MKKINQPKADRYWAIVLTTKLKNGRVKVELKPQKRLGNAQPCIFPREAQARAAADHNHGLFEYLPGGAETPPIYSVIPTDTVMYERLAEQFEKDHEPLELTN